MPIEYIQEALLDTMVQEVLDMPDFVQLRSHEVKITSCLKVKLDDTGEWVIGKGDAASLKKVGSPYCAFIEKDFILVYDGGHWNNFDSRRKACIHKALMRIKLSVSDAGVIKFGTRGPDIQEFTSTLRHFGAYTDDLQVLGSISSAIAESMDQLVPAE